MEHITNKAIQGALILLSLWLCCLFIAMSALLYLGVAACLGTIGIFFGIQTVLIASGA